MAVRRDFRGPRKAEKCPNPECIDGLRRLQMPHGPAASVAARARPFSTDARSLSASRRNSAISRRSACCTHGQPRRCRPAAASRSPTPTSPTPSSIPDTAGFYRIRVENAPCRARIRRSKMAKIVGFGTGLFPYFECPPDPPVTPVGDPVFADLDSDGSQDVTSLGWPQTVGRSW